MELILASSACDTAGEIICVPQSVNELFEAPFIGGVNRTMILTILAALVVVGLLYFGIVRHRNRLVPSRFGAAIEALVTFVRDEIAIGIIGPEHGLKYFPWLLSIFLFALVGNLFEVTPFVNFPVTSRMWVFPATMAILTWIIFLASGFKEQGIKYFLHTIFPPGFPGAQKLMYILITPIEFFSTFFIRPFSLAVRLFANMVAGHLMLTLLLVSGFVFITGQGGVAKIPVGAGWYALGVGIYVFEIVVAVLQAYIFVLLSAVYVQTAVHPEH